MADKYSTIQQHQPLRVPSGWDRQEKMLIVQLDEVFDDIYRRFGRLRFEDMGKDFRQRIEDDEGNYTQIRTDVDEITLEVGGIDGVMTSLGMTQAGINLTGGKYIKLSSGDYIEIGSNGTISIKSGGALTLEGGNFSIDSSGNVTLKGEAEILGDKSLTIKSGGHLKVEANSDIEIATDGTFEIKSGGIFRVSSGNLDVDETGLEVKSGLLKGDHYTPDGAALLSQNDIVVSTEEPDSFDGKIWVKPLDSAAVNYRLNVPASIVLDNFTGTLTTGGPVTGLTGTFTYRLKFLVRAGTSSGTGCDVTATIGGLTFTQHINQGSYSGNTYDGERTFDASVTSNTWLGDQASLSIALNASASGYEQSYKIKAGSIEFTATGTGTGGSGWKSCEIKVYKG